MRTWKKALILFTAIILGLLIFNWTTISESYHWLNYSKYEKRAYYFQNQEQVFSHRVVSKASDPYHFPVVSNFISLPDSFSYEDSLINTNNFLDDMGYEGILISKKGKIIYENYWRGMDKSTTHSAMSMSKSILSILVGFAVDDGLIESTTDKIVKYLPEYVGTSIEHIKISDCLDMLSGIKFCDFCDSNESYSTLTQFFWHFSLKKPLREFVSHLDVSASPYEQWNYQTMDAILVGLVLNRVLGESTISEYTHEKLWEPLGAEYDAQWLMGGEELELVGSNFTATLRDLAKIGQFYLQKGRWQNKQLLSEDWIIKSTIPDKQILQPGVNSSDTLANWGYKHFWWIPENVEGHEFMAAGRFGQVLYVNVEKEIVIVGLRIGPDPDKSDTDHRFNLESKVQLFQKIAYTTD